MREIIEQVGGHLEGEAGLARAPWACERDQGDLRPAEEGAHLRYLLLATDEHCGLEREVIWAHFEGLEGREIGGQAGRDGLVNMLGPREVLQAALAQVAEGDRLGQGVAHEALD